MVLLQQTAVDVILIVNDMALKMLGMAKEDIIGYYMLSVLSLEDEFKLEEIQENNDSFLLDLNEEEGLIANVLTLVRLCRKTGFNWLYRCVT